MKKLIVVFAVLCFCGVVSAQGTGLDAVFYNSDSFINSEVARIDGTVDFDEGSAALEPSFSPSGYSVIWSGLI